MRDYAELVKALRYCANNSLEDCESCPRTNTHECNSKDMMLEEADAIEELLARVPDTNVGKCKDCATQHIDPDGMRWCEENSMVVADDFYCGYWENPEPPKEVER